MKIAKILLAATLPIYILGFSTAAFQTNRDVSDFDGVDWESLPESWQLGFIEGVLNGVHLALMNLPSSASGSIGKKPDYSNVMDNLTLSDITVGQFKDGVDSFYKDFSNRRVKVVDAIYMVKMHIRGAAQELIEAQIRYLKMQPINLQTKMRLKLHEYITQKGHFPTYEEIKKGDYSSEDLLRVGWVFTSDGKRYLLFCYGEYE